MGTVSRDDREGSQKHLSTVRRLAYRLASDLPFLAKILSALVDNTMKKGNPLGISKDRLSAWSKGLGPSISSETVLYTGCEYQLIPYILPLVERLKGIGAFESGGGLANITFGLRRLGIDLIGSFASLRAKEGEYYNELVKKHFLLIRKVNDDITYLPDELYPGAILYDFGFFEDFTEQAKKVTRLLKEKGVRTVITISPHSLEMFRAVYPSYVDGFDVDVLHYTEVLLKYESKLRFSADEPTSVTLHDPCHLARTMNIFEEPRAILNSIKSVEFREVPYANKRWTTCCGAPIETLLPIISESIGCKRIKELEGSGASIALTLCPFCLANLKKAASTLNSQLKVMDFVELLSWCVK